MSGDGSESVARIEPDWVRHAILWQVYPLGFVGAPVSLEAQAAGVDPDTGAGADAGAGAVAAAAEGAGAGGAPPHSLERLVGWLDYAVELGVSGILLGPVFRSETHGYDTTDYLHIDERLGGDSAFDTLVAEAHSRGLRVVLDGVFNHVGRGFEPFRRALDTGPTASEFGWFRALGEHPGDPRLQAFENFEGHDALVALNHDEPQVADFVATVMNRWLDRGADGWRLDAAYAVPPTFWATVLPQVRKEHPEAYVFGEVIHGDYAAIVAESTLDSLTQYELWKAIWSAIADANFFELSAALERHDTFLKQFVPVTFIGNHDVTRLASAVQDERHRSHALVVLMTLGGTPTIYYGDEQGFTGVKEERAGGDDAVRPEYPASGPSELDPEGWPTYHLHQNLIGLRRRHPWLHSARTAKLALTNEFFAYETRSSTGAERLIVLLNLGDAPYTQAIPADAPDGAALVAGAADLRPQPGGSGCSSALSVTVPPHGWAVVRPAQAALRATNEPDAAGSPLTAA